MIFLVLLIPIGIIVYIYERRVFKENRLILQGYIRQEISENKDLNLEQKIQRTQKLLDNNNYKVVKKDGNSIIGQKKIFSVGLLFIGMFVLYIIYYYLFQKPDEIGYINK
jgi:hypothetical protein